MNMSDGREKSPMSIDIGLKAGLEVKAEIPKASVARLVDSLTDIIRPFTEQRGLRADQIRLQREDIAMEIARKARSRAEIENIALNPVSMKMLIPFLEKASTEDTDTAMHDRWAALLLSASKEFHSRHLTFLDILGRLSSDEVKILEEVCFSYRAFPETYYPGGHIEENRSRVEAAAPSLAAPSGSAHGVAGQLYQKFIDETRLIYGEVMHASVHVAGGNTYYFYSNFGSVESPGFRSLEILQRERLLDIERLKMPEIKVEIAYFNLTFLGVSFVRDCSPDASRMAARRASPVIVAAVTPPPAPSSLPS
jgi:hypothetical protein